MARSVVTAIVPLGSYPGTALVTAWTAVGVDGSKVLKTERDLLLVRNNSTASTTFTVKSSADPLGRTGDIVVTLAGSAQVVIGPLTMLGWIQSDGYLWLDASSVNVQVMVLALP